MPPRIFISYRRDDAGGDAGRLADHLHRRFGAAHVFLDIDTIAPGSDFVDVLHTSLQQTAAMLVVIGPRWLSVRAANGTRRLDDPNDFVRREVETALGRGIPVVPVLVQSAPLPRAEELPRGMAALATRQAVSLDHAEFHDDAERLCDRLAPLMQQAGLPARHGTRRWWPAAVVVAALLAVTLGIYGSLRTSAPATRGATGEDSQQAALDALLAEAAAQRRRDQFADALATLSRAREAAPSSQAVQRLQGEVAMEWIRRVRVRSGTQTFGEAIKPALAVVDAALPTATGTHRADLLAHSGWAAFLMWRDGNRRLDPSEWYGEALSVDATNPYANAMLAHWRLFRDDDVRGAAALFATALRARRATEAVRMLQWAAYGNSSEGAADVELVRLADEMRRGGERLTAEQAQRLWRPYYFAMLDRRTPEREALLDSIPPDDHIRTIEWAFEDYAAGDDARRRTMRFYIALLHAEAGRAGQAATDLQTLRRDLASHPGSLQDAVQAALTRMAPAAR